MDLDYHGAVISAVDHVVMKLELISFKICPFVQRSVITLLHKGVDFTLTHIELEDPPDWFAALSPFGRVPLLRVDAREVVFESAVINEFLDEATPGSLLPQEPLRRAIDRSWIEFGTAALMDFSGLIHAGDPDAYTAHGSALANKLRWLEQRLEAGPWFNGETLSLVDFAWAPLFMRLQLLDLQHVAGLPELPKVSAWSRACLALDAVQGSVTDDFAERLRAHIRAKSPVAAARLRLTSAQESASNR